MRKLSFIKKLVAIISIVCLSLVSCGKKEKERISIPPELAGNKATIEYFETLEKFIDEYATMVLELAENSKKIKESGKEVGFADRMSAMSSVASSTFKMLEMAEKLEKLEKEADVMKKDMSPQEVEAFSKMYVNVIKRFYDASKEMEAIKQ